MQETTCNDTHAALSNDLIRCLDKTRKDRWNERVTNIDFTHSSRKAWQTFRQLTNDPSLGKRKYPVTANQIAHQLLLNGKCPGDKEFSRKVSAELRELSSAPTADTHDSRPFSIEELTKAIKTCKQGKAPGVDHIHNEFLHHIGPVASRFLLNILNICLSTCHIPSQWRKTKVVAIPKPGKPLDQPKSYRPISLLCAPYKLFERLILERITPVVETVLPREQAGFRSGRSTADQVTLLTEDIEQGFEAKLKSGVVLVDLTAAYDTVWHRGLASKLHKCIPNRQLVNMIMELIRNRTFTLHVGDSKSRTRSQRNGLPQGSVLAPSLFNIYTSDLPLTQSSKYVYADDICLALQNRSLDILSSGLTEDLVSMCAYFKRWKLKLSEAKTVVSAFHLDNNLADAELDVTIDGRRLRHEANPTYLGVTLDRTLTYKKHLMNLRAKVGPRVNLTKKIAGTSWGADAQTLRTTTLALVYSTAEYCAPVWEASTHTHQVDVELRSAMRTISGTVSSTPSICLPVLSNIPPPHLRRRAITLRTTLNARLNPNNLLHRVVHSQPKRKRLKSRKPFSERSRELVDAQPYQLQEPGQVKSYVRALVQDWWLEEWQAQDNPLTGMRAPGNRPIGFDLPRESWCTLNRVLTGHGRSNHMMYKWGLSSSPECDCGAAVQSCHHIVSECPRRKFPGGLESLAALDAGAQDWLSQLDIKL